MCEITVSRLAVMGLPAGTRAQWGAKAAARTRQGHGKDMSMPVPNTGARPCHANAMRSAHGCNAPWQAHATSRARALCARWCKLEDTKGRSARAAGVRGCRSRAVGGRHARCTSMMRSHDGSCRGPKIEAGGGCVHLPAPQASVKRRPMLRGRERTQQPLARVTVMERCPSSCEHTPARRPGKRQVDDV